MAARYTVEKNEVGGWDGTCAEPGCEFQSFGWGLKKDASERMDAHIEEHDTGEPMPEVGVWMGEFDADAPVEEEEESA